jgi:hypothetical protein
VRGTPPTPIDPRSHVGDGEPTGMPGLHPPQVRVLAKINKIQVFLEGRCRSARRLNGGLWEERGAGGGVWNEEDQELS